MRNASPRDTRAGFDIYLRSSGEITLDELNRRLALAGYGPVRQRSFTHYRNLIEASFNRYIPINRFDIARASKPYDDAGANARYRYESVDTGVELLLAKGSKLFEAHGRATELGETGCIMQLTDRTYIDGVVKLKPRPGDMASIRFLESSRTVAATVVDVDTSSLPATIELEYSTLMSIAEFGTGTPLPRTRAGFRLLSSDDDQQSIDVVGRRLYLFFEVLEEVRGLVNTAAAEADEPTFAEQTVLESLRIASPPTFVFDVAESITALLRLSVVAAALKVATQVPAWRREWIEGSGAKLDNKLKQLQLDEAEHAAMTKRRQNELVVAAVDEARLVFPAATESHLHRIAEQRVAPAIDRLGRSGVSEIEIFDPHDE